MACPLTRTLSPGNACWSTRFLSIGPHVLPSVSFEPFLTESPLPLARTFVSIPTDERIPPVLVQETRHPISSCPSGRTPSALFLHKLIFAPSL
jgi:hypothetical protein